MHISDKASLCPSFTVSPLRVLRLYAQVQRLQFAAMWHMQIQTILISFSFHFPIDTHKLRFQGVLEMLAGKANKVSVFQILTPLYRVVDI